MRNELGLELDERDFARQPLGAGELKKLFGCRDPRDFLNRKSPTFRKMGLKDRKLSPSETLKLMAEEPNLIKRPLVAVGAKLLAGFDRELLREALS